MNDSNVVRNYLAGVKPGSTLSRGEIVQATKVQECGPILTSLVRGNFLVRKERSIYKVSDHIAKVVELNTTRDVTPVARSFKKRAGSSSAALTKIASAVERADVAHSILMNAMKTLSKTKVERIDLKLVPTDKLLQEISRRAK